MRSSSSEKRTSSSDKDLAASGSRRCALRAWAATFTLVVFASCVWRVDAQEVKIGPRCLTPQERKSYTNASPAMQLAGDRQNVGIGQPLYLQALVTKGTVVTQVNWTLLGRPTGSTAALQASILTNNAYDVGDQNTYDVAGRTLLVPDVACTASSGDYIVVVRVLGSGMDVTVTNRFYGSTYLGIDNYYCTLCHEGRTNVYGETAHATAFQRKINGSDGSAFTASCVSCHVLGYDTNAIATNGGFDDVWARTGWTFPTNLGQTNMVSGPTGWTFPTNLASTNWAATNWAALPASVRSNASVQCENCHGPADRHKRGLGDTNAIAVSLSAGNCGQCHDSRNNYSGNYQWSQSMHATGYVFRTSGSCAACHSAKGFIALYDADYGENYKPRGTGNEGITCVACHDPHGMGMGENQLRSISSVTLGNGSVVTGGGDGILCMSCHKSRYDAASYVVDQVGSSDFGPHHGPQADMLVGTNAIEYGMQMPRSRHFDLVSNSCVACHMQETSTSPLATNHVGGHTFSLRWIAGTPGVEGDDVMLTESCRACHGGLTSFNFGGEDYDRDGVVEGVQKEIEGLLDTVGRLLPPVGITNIDCDDSFTLPQKEAYYNYRFVKEDGSRGVHNAKYAASLLQASIDDLRGGIDVDRDGLLDSWELAHFGNLSGQKGSDDTDSDGAPNALEMAAGTNPNSSDSDADGAWDAAELRGGSDPLDSGSTPGTNCVTTLPAAELGYLPGTMGATQRIQAVGTLDTGSWTNVGSGAVNSNAWFYQLWSTRDASQKFFRATVAP